MNADIVFLIRTATIEGSTLIHLRKELRALTGKGRKIVLDFSSVEAANTACAGLVLEIADRLQRMGGNLQLVGVRKNVAAFFELLRIPCDVEMRVSRTGNAGLPAAA
jgi:anti-anti-sigma regulatory factor